MRADDLSCQQADALRVRVGPMLGYLNRLKRRMVQRRFPPDDPLLKLVCEAAGVMHNLHVDLIYRSCGNVTMRRSTKGNVETKGEGNESGCD